VTSGAACASYEVQLERGQANYTDWKGQIARNTRLRKSGATSVQDLVIEGTPEGSVTAFWWSSRSPERLRAEVR
jgi:hypothetical protein